MAVFKIYKPQVFRYPKMNENAVITYELKVK